MNTLELRQDLVGRQYEPHCMHEETERSNKCPEVK